MTTCAAALDADAARARVSFGAGGNNVPNYQVNCNNRSFAFSGNTHLPFSGPAQNLTDHVKGYFREGEFLPSHMLIGSWSLPEISFYADKAKPDDEAVDFEFELVSKYEGMTLPMPVDDPNPGNARRCLRQFWSVQRDRLFRERLLMKQDKPNHCAVCDLMIKDGLQGAHVVDVQHGGKDIVSNGLVLCGTHHLLFDAHLFGIDPKTRAVMRRSDGPTLGMMQITRTTLHESVGDKALNERWPRFNALAGW